MQIWNDSKWVISCQYFKYHDGAESLMFELSKWIIATSHGTYIRTFVLYFHKSLTASYASKGFYVWMNISKNNNRNDCE